MPGTKGWTRGWLFLYDVGWLLALALVGWWFFTGTFPAGLTPPPRLASTPTGVLWFGALGGTLISLAGVHEHRWDWEDRYSTWHLVRPLVGAGVAAVAALIVQAGILAVGVDPSSPTGPPTKDVFYYLVAFVTGYREATFRAMVKRLADVILSSADQGPAPVISAVDPHNGVAAGNQTVKIIGSGFSDVQAVRFGATEALFKVSSDGVIEATTPPGSAGQVAVTVITATRSASAVQAFTYDP